MLMGLWNAPVIHQCWMAVALQEHIGKICHVYMDDIVIWSQLIEEHHCNVHLILNTL